MEVRAKKALGQHFLTDQSIAMRIVDALQGTDVLEVGPGMGVLTQYLLKNPSVILSEAKNLKIVEIDKEEAKNLKVVEIDKESVVYLKKHFPALGEGLIEGDFLKMDLSGLFPGPFSIIGNFPYNISSQIFFKIIDNRDLVPEVVCMIQKEVAQRIAEKPGTKTYGILSVFLQAWYDIEYLFTVGPGAFNPPPKVQSAVIRLTRNSRTSLGCDEKLFRTVVKTAFGQRRKTLRNSLKPLLANRNLQSPNCQPQSPDCQPLPPDCHPEQSEGSLASDPIFDLRPERLSVEDFIALTLRLQ
ncbi:MAG: ribosomal RNA small subunit methyltransferase A [Bacteroidales bacterium]|nr:ribosomal RNA small subunit methyltransferase A [Bacteroidales bacterium]